MIQIKEVFEENEKVVTFLKKRDLINQYKKAKNKIIIGDFSDLKLRQPKQEGIWYFRVNRQYRAYAVLKDDSLVVYKIDNHQNG